MWFDTYFTSAESHGVEEENHRISVHENQVDDNSLVINSRAMKLLMNLLYNLNLTSASNQHLNEPQVAHKGKPYTIGRCFCTPTFVQNIFRSFIVKVAGC